MSVDPVQRLQDLESIRDLARLYAHHVWQKDIPAAIDLFAEDGVMDTGDRPAIHGKQELLKVYGEMLGDALFHPFVHNHVIDLQGDRATGVCYLDLRAIVEGQSMIGSGYYHDEYLRVDGEWKFKSRTLTMCYFVPLSEGWAEAENS